MFTVKKVDYLFWTFIFLIILLQLSTNNDLNFPAAFVYTAAVVATMRIHAFLIRNTLVTSYLKNNDKAKFILYTACFSILSAFLLTLEGHLIMKIMAPNDQASQTVSGLVSIFFGMVLFTILISGGIYSIELIKQNVAAEKRHQELKNSVLEMEIDHLRTQLSPHFTFNILNNLQFLIRKDADEALELLSRYSKILRYYVYESQNRWIKLEDEVAFLKHYFELEKGRTGDDLQISCQWDIPENKLLIIPFVLSAFVENAFKHAGVAPDKTHYIHMRLFLENDSQLFLEIENTVPPETNGSKKEGVGLKHAQKRLELSYPGNYHLALLPETGKYSVKLQLNLDKG